MSRVEAELKKPFKKRVFTIKHKIPMEEHTFRLGSTTVVEYVWDEWSVDNKKGKILWVRDDLAKLTVSDKDNMLVHTEYEWGIDAVEVARSAVEKEFRKYWELQK